MDKKQFVSDALRAAREACASGAPIVPEIVAAQAALESAFGASRLSAEANNLFGIKAGRSWEGPVVVWETREFDPEAGWTMTRAAWRRYPDWTTCFRDYAAILERLSWYADAVAAARAGDAEGFLRGLLPNPHGPGRADDEPGWSTDPRYFEKVMSIVRVYGLVKA